MQKFSLISCSALTIQGACNTCIHKMECGSNIKENMNKIIPVLHMIQYQLIYNS